MTDQQTLIDGIMHELNQARQVLETFVHAGGPEKTAQAIELMAGQLKAGHKIISCGNGGSHCDAMHFAEELSGRFRNNRPAIAALAISDVSHISCVGNDYGFDYIFSRAVEAYGQSGDVLLAISTSGNSKNVIEAIKAAHARSIKVVALTGKDGGLIAGLLNDDDVEIRVPHTGYADRVQEVHIKVIHNLILGIERVLGYN